MIFTRNDMPEGHVDEQQITTTLRDTDIHPDAAQGILSDVVNTLRGGTSGKAPVSAEGAGQYYSGWHNRIPADEYGPCTSTLVAYCFDGDSFKERLNDVVKHMAVCPGTQHIVIITSQWNPKEWKKNHERYFQQISARVNILFSAFNQLTRIL
jgi:hypothetical protein